MKALVLMLLLICPVAMFSQQVTDSVLKVLATSKEDTNKVLLLITIGQNIENNKPEEAKRYYREAKNLSERLNYKMGIIKFYSNYTSALNIQGRYDSSLELNKQAVTIAESFGNNERIAIAQQNLSASYAYTEDYENAIKYHLLSLPFFEKNYPESRFSLVYDNLGVYYKETKQYEKALEYHQKALVIARKYKDSYDIATVLSNAGIALTSLKRYKEALVVLKEALEFGRKDSNEYIQGHVLTDIGNILIQQSSYDSLFYYSSEGLRIANKIGDSRGITSNTYGIALYFFFKKEFSKSQEKATEGLALSQKMKYAEKTNLFADLLSKLALVNGDLKNYDYYQRLSDESAEQAFNEGMQHNVQLLDKKYETEKKKQQLKLQQSTIRQKNILNYIFIGGLAALLLISLLSYRTYQQKRKIQEEKITTLEKEKQLSATQSLLKGQEEERNRLAKDLHDGLGGLLSGVKLQLGAMKGNLILSEEMGKSFNNALGKLDESISEMRRVAHNMMPEALMKLGLQQALQDYCDGLSESQLFKINCEFHGLEKRMEASTEVVIYRIVQELLNNAVKHSGATTILAQVMRHDDNLAVTVEDNGKGFDKAIIPHGAGLKNIQSRVDYLNGQLDVKSTPGKGTSVHIDCIIEDNG